MNKLILNNTITHKEEPLETDGKVKLYVCGVTPYADSHLGHGRCYVVFDILYRVLTLLGYEVTYVRNFTDIDDKIINKATESGNASKYIEVANKYIKSFHEDMSALGCKKPSKEPRVTENIPEIITFIKELIKKNKAYVVNNDVYFDTASFSEYGKLSGKKIEDQLSGARVGINKDKKNPSDFALWKGNDQGLYWESPWGHGRPGWHIECSALAKKFLGDTIDIHGGGMDLIFPHHENEIAQTEALTGKEFSKIWLHNAFINIDKQKMSKSLGNFFTLKEIFKKYDPMVLRYYFLQHHYRTPIDFSVESLEAVNTAYKKLVKVLSKFECEDSYNKELPVIKEMMQALLADLNTPKLLGILFENIGRLSQEELKDVKTFLCQSTGLTFAKVKKDYVEITPEIKKLIAERNAAREAGNWSSADEIRDKLKQLGVDVNDAKIKS